MSVRDSPVLVTGGAGYVGSAVVRDLLAGGYRVRVVDYLRFGGESLLGVLGHPRFELSVTDIRDRAALPDVLEGCGAVLHLAAVVGDPACQREPKLAMATNREASMALYDLAEAAGCETFVFASTCSNYGKMTDSAELMTEDSRLAPVSLYAETKVDSERFLLDQPSRRRCKPTCLRFSTAYGLSPRMRFDLTVNEFTRDLALGRELLVYGEQFWRPYCHVDDLSRAMRLVLEAEPSKVAFEVFNVGATTENYTKQMIVDELRKRIPGAVISYKKVDEDPRNYRVDSGKLEKRLGFSITKTVPDGIAEIAAALQAGVFSDPDDSRYSNI